MKRRAARGDELWGGARHAQRFPTCARLFHSRLAVNLSPRVCPYFPQSTFLGQKNLLASLGSRRAALLSRFASQRVLPCPLPAAARASGAMSTPPGSPERKHSWGAVKLGQVFLLPSDNPKAPPTPARVVLESKRRVQVRAPRRPAPPPARETVSRLSARRARARRAPTARSAPRPRHKALGDRPAAGSCAHWPSARWDTQESLASALGAAQALPARAPERPPDRRRGHRSREALATGSGCSATTSG